MLLVLLGGGVGALLLTLFSAGSPPPLQAQSAPTLISNEGGTINLQGADTVEVCFNLPYVEYEGTVYLERRPGKTQVTANPILADPTHGVDVFNSNNNPLPSQGRGRGVNLNPCVRVGIGHQGVRWSWYGPGGGGARGFTTTIFTVANQDIEAAAFFRERVASDGGNLIATWFRFDLTWLTAGRFGANVMTDPTGHNINTHFWAYNAEGEELAKVALTRPVTPQILKTDELTGVSCLALKLEDRDEAEVTSIKVHFTTQPPATNTPLPPPGVVRGASQPREETIDPTPARRATATRKPTPPATAAPAALPTSTATPTTMPPAATATPTLMPAAIPPDAHAASPAGRFGRHQLAAVGNNCAGGGRAGCRRSISVPAALGRPGG